MKKLLLSFACTAFMYHAGAQITITRSDFGSIGDKTYFANDTTVASTVSVGAAGAGQTWNFSTVLAADVYDSTSFTDATSDPKAPVGSNIRIITGTDTQYLQVNTNRARMMVNATAPLSGILQLDILRFPTNYQSEFYDSAFAGSSGPAAAYGLPAIFDSASVFARIDAHILCDGWGTLTTPAGSYSSLRLFNSISSQFVVFGRVASTMQWTPIAYQANSEYSYSWLANGQKDIVAEAKIDSASHITQFRYKVGGLPTGILAPQISALQVYPNPATQNLNLAFSLSHNADVTVSVSDLQGHEVHTENRSLNAGDQKLTMNIEHLSPGFYICHLRGGDMLLDRKFSVNRH